MCTDCGIKNCDNFPNQVENESLFEETPMQPAKEEQDDKDKDQTKSANGKQDEKDQPVQPHLVAQDKPAATNNQMNHYSMSDYAIAIVLVLICALLLKRFL